MSFKFVCVSLVKLWSSNKENEFTMFSWIKVPKGRDTTIKGNSVFVSTQQHKHRVTIPCKWSFEKWRFSWKAALFTNGLPSVLYETPGLNERSVLNQLFLMISGAFHMKSTTLFMKRAMLFIWKVLHFIWKALHFMKSAAFHFELLGDDQV